MEPDGFTHIAWGCLYHFVCAGFPRTFHSRDETISLALLFSLCVTALGLKGKLKTKRMDNLGTEKYDPPAVEVLVVAVERGFADSDTDTKLPQWEGEPGYWQ